ncbi:MAG: hypothetical protein R3F56_07605 [Planctomycetota bacterium]
MKKVAIVCLDVDRDRTLARLRALGVLHVTPVQAPAGGDVDAARKTLESVRAALALLPPADDALPTGLTDEATLALADTVHALVARRRDLDQQIGQLVVARQAQAPFGDFDPDQARVLRDHGVRLRLYQFPTKGPVPAVPAGASLTVLGTTAGTTSAVLVGPEAATLAAREVALPEQSLRSLDEEIDAGRRECAGLEVELANLTPTRPALQALATRLEDELQLLEARAGMGSRARLAWITGFCPEPAISAVEAAAAHGQWALSVTTPSAHDQVPTQLASKPWVRQIHAVLDMIGITPGYGEPDVSPVFLLFLVLFAAMLIGDAGYGALILLGTWFARRKWRQAPAQPFHLLRSVGIATMAWGTLTGTWFALPHLPAALDALRLEWLAGSDKLLTTRHVMLLCFFLGAAHITLAHLWAAARCGRRPAALAQLGWIATTWCMFFVAKTMVLGDAFPAWMLPVTIAGIAAIVLFMTPPRQLKDEWFNHVMLPLNLVSNFVDVVSYLRLFAVGTAGVAVAAAFNGMAAKVGAGGGMGLVGAALIAVFGHTLNLVLCAMGVLVHGVRLNTLEFSAHLGLQWSGVPYRPLRQRAGGQPAAATATTNRRTNGLGGM